MLIFVHSIDVQINETNKKVTADLRSKQLCHMPIVLENT